MSRASWMKWAWAALAAALFAVVFVAAAAPAYAYDYTVRVWAGNQGTVDGSDEYAEVTVKNKGEITLSKAFDAVATNEKYYVKGFRPGGADNQKMDQKNNVSTGVSNLRDAIVVTEDMDFVVAYGVKGDMVSYTLHFVEQGTGKVLADPITRYGARGDKPVAAYEYVSGYRPLYRNITGTLGEEGTNDWTFEYVKEEAPSAQSSSSTSGRTTVTQGATGTTGTGTTGATGTGTQQGATGATGTQSTQATQGAQQPAATPTPPQTEEILDQDTPLASTPSAGDTGTSTDTSANQPDNTGWILAAVAAALAAAAVVIFMLMKRRKEEEMASE